MFNTLTTIYWGWTALERCRVWDRPILYLANFSVLQEMFCVPCLHSDLIKTMIHSNSVSISANWSLFLPVLNNKRFYILLSEFSSLLSVALTYHFQNKNTKQKQKWVCLPKSNMYIQKSQAFQVLFHLSSMFFHQFLTFFIAKNHAKVQIALSLLLNTILLLDVWVSSLNGIRPQNTSCISSAIFICLLQMCLTCLKSNPACLTSRL